MHRKQTAINPTKMGPQPNSSQNIAHASVILIDVAVIRHAFFFFLDSSSLSVSVMHPRSLFLLRTYVPGMAFFSMTFCRPRYHVRLPPPPVFLAHHRIPIDPHCKPTRVYVVPVPVPLLLVSSLSLAWFAFVFWRLFMGGNGGGGAQFHRSGRAKDARKHHGEAEETREDRETGAKLEYRDQWGRAITRKEAFRNLCYQVRWTTDYSSPPSWSWS